MQGAWALLLSRYSGERDVCFGATVSGRPAELPDVDEIIGIFINTLPVRVEVDDSVPVARWLQALQTAQTNSRQFEHVPLTQLQAWSGIPGGTNLFDSVMVFENYPIDQAAAAEHGVRLREVQGIEATNYPLSAVVYPRRRLSVLLGYEPALFDADTIEEMAHRLRLLVAGIVDSADRPLLQLPWMSPAEGHQVLVEWNDTGRDVPAALVTELFEAQVARTPDATAVLSEGQELTYAELNEAANALAHLLIEKGAGPERFVALALPRSAETVVALLAVLKAGAAYLPIDPSYPAERIAFMLADADPALVLTTGDLADRLPESGAPRVLLDQPDTLAQLSAYPDVGVEDDERYRPPSLSSPAYVIYTSGSTGRPKGVVVPLAGLVNFLTSMQERFDLGPGDRLEEDDLAAPPSGRHVIGSNYFRYVRDPWGSFAEYSYDIDFIPADVEWKAADHEPADSFYVWGPPVPDYFIVNHETAGRQQKAA